MPDTWQAPDEQWPPLGADEVHAWLFPLDAPVRPIDDLALLLDDAERQRAARFVFERDRRRFIAGRGMLRLLLGRHAGIDPARLAFALGPQGKPSIATPAVSTPLEFNLSHSQGWALLGVGHGGVIGVDIEVHRDIPEAEQIAASHFAPNELRQFLALPASQREAGFFACWTRKEAYVKALGGGLTVPLDRFEVAFVPGDKPRLRSIDESEQAAREWTLWDIDVGHGMTAAVIVHATGSVLRRMSVAGSLLAGGS
jgi:4'-phosphopantetheinyl transferase